MTTEPLTTDFAPAERAEPEDVQAQRRELLAHPLIGALLESVHEPVMVLNGQRQIVLANEKLAVLLKRLPESLIGLRPGEAVGCIHPADAPGGCGTTRFCRYCGAVNAILNSQGRGEPDEQECRIQRLVDGEHAALDVRARATPLRVDDQQFTVFALYDLGDEKRRQVLERLFFHDVLNTAGGLRGLLEMWPELGGEDAMQVIEEARSLTERLIDEIQSQRDLAAAERGDLKLKIDLVDTTEVLLQLCNIYRHHSIAEGKTLVVRNSTKHVLLQSDEQLFRRVLANLIKNALEASGKGQTVTVWADDATTPTFRVHNESVMSEEVQAQIFQRSFSTKEGAGRGLGTYGAKVLTENYLQGTIEFRSTRTEGTTFIMRLPARLERLR